MSEVSFHCDAPTGQCLREKEIARYREALQSIMTAEEQWGDFAGGTRSYEIAAKALGSRQDSPAPNDGSSGAPLPERKGEGDLCALSSDEYEPMRPCSNGRCGLSWAPRKGTLMSLCPECGSQPMPASDEDARCCHGEKLDSHCIDCNGPRKSSKDKQP